MFFKMHDTVETVRGLVGDTVKVLSWDAVFVTHLRGVRFLFRLGATLTLTFSSVSLSTVTAVSLLELAEGDVLRSRGCRLFLLTLGAATNELPNARRRLLSRTVSFFFLAGLGYIRDSGDETSSMGNSVLSTGLEGRWRRGTGLCSGT